MKFIHMRRFFFFFFLLYGTAVFAQLNEKYVRKVLSELSSDAYMGRASGTPYADKAAAFIAAGFKKAGLQPMQGEKVFLQRFEMIRSRTVSVNVTVDGQQVPASDVLVLAGQPELDWTTGAVEPMWMEKGSPIGQRVFAMSSEKGDKLIFADTSNRRQLARLKNFSMQRFGGGGSIVVVLTTGKPSAYRVKASSELKATGFQNVVGMIPGKRSEEYVIFSGHYDHIGTGKPVEGDSIYNGANDDASGITAVMALAGHFARMKQQPERTILFVAFTAEETGGYGSTWFSRQLAPDKVVAMFNIEMIGTESKWGRNSAYITGFERSDFGKILQDNLQGTGFQFHPDPYPQQNLFFRSDNATLARLGVPAHTISTSKMDSEPFYHTVNDEIETLDIANMTAIIRAIALSSQWITSGKSTPSRVSLSR